MSLGQDTELPAIRCPAECIRLGTIFAEVDHAANLSSCGAHCVGSDVSMFADWVGIPRAAHQHGGEDASEVAGLRRQLAEARAQMQSLSGALRSAQALVKQLQVGAWQLRRPAQLGIGPHSCPPFCVVPLSARTNAVVALLPTGIQAGCARQLYPDSFLRMHLNMCTHVLA